MEKKVRCIELRTIDGRPFLKLYVYDREVTLDENRKESECDEKTKMVKGETSQTDKPLMTSAQKRYLFRILAERGIEGDKAHEQLKNLFQVDSLKEISKIEASRMIEHLLEEAKGGGDDGAPF